MPSWRLFKNMFVFFNDTATTEIYTLSLHDALPILVKAGAFDSVGHRRRALVAVHEAVCEQYVEVKRNEAIGQDSLFGGLDEGEGDSWGGGWGVNATVPRISEWDKQTMLVHEIGRAACWE